jgi:hypothetical protein
MGGQLECLAQVVIYVVYSLKDRGAGYFQSSEFHTLYLAGQPIQRLISISPYLVQNIADDLLSR